MNQRRKPNITAVETTANTEGIGTPQFMKTIPKFLKVSAVLCTILAARSGFGANVLWSGGNGTGTEIGLATNWVGGVLPSTANNDTAQWDGSVPGTLSLLYNTTAFVSGPGNSGINLYLLSTQTGGVTIGSTPGAQSAALAITHVGLDPGAGPLTIGNTVGAQSPINALNIIGRPSGAVHIWANNSSSLVTINPWVRWTAGGGSAYTLDFQGSGNFVANNYLNNDNNSGGTLIQVDGPGTLTWNPSGYLGSDNINSPIAINGGGLILKGAHPKLVNQQIGIGGFFEFNAPSQSQSLGGQITGPGTLTVTAGTLTLGGLSDYTGGTFLNGGELVVNRVETPGVNGPLGNGNTISFGGGTLKYSLNNLFDYSGRFSTAAGQQFRIDTANQNVTFTNTAGISSTGGTFAKTNVGILTLAGPSAWTGGTTVSGGKLVFQGTKTGPGSVTVADAASVDFYATGTQVTPTALTIGNGSALEFDNVNSTTTAVIAAGTVSGSSSITVNINSGTLAPGNSYPLFSWSSGPAPAVTLGVLNGFIGNLSTNGGNTITLNVTATAYKWTGNNNGSWDLTTANNWQQNGGPVIFANGGPALFDDTSANQTITITGVVLPTAITVNNVNSNYSIASSVGNNIGGSASLTKSGSGTLTLSGGANAHTGITVINNGIISVGTLANGGVASDIGQANSDPTNLVFNGGTLQYTGAGASIDRSFTLGLSGGTLDASGAAPLNLNAASLGYSGPGPRSFTLTGTGISNTFATPIVNNGGATALTKSGAGSWVLTANNSYSGITTIGGGILQVGNGGATGSLGSGGVVNNGNITFYRSGTNTVAGAISGTGSVTNLGPGTVILAGNNSYNGAGGTYIAPGATVQIGNGGATGTLDNNTVINDDGLLIFNTTGNIVIKGFAGVINGSGNVIVRGSGIVECAGNNTYTGWTQIDPGATFQTVDGNSGTIVSSVITNNGTLLFLAQEFDPAGRGYSNNIVGTGRVVKDNNNQNAGWIVLGGTNTYTGNTFIAGGGVQIGDGITPDKGSIVGSVIFTNTTSPNKNTRTLIFDRPGAFTFTNRIFGTVTDGSAVADQGALLQHNTNSTVTLTGNNTYPGSTTVNAGTLEVGNGGTSGSIGTGNINVLDPLGLFKWNRSDDVTLSNVITGLGSIEKAGAGKLTLTANSTYTGTNTVSGGTLIINGTNAAINTIVLTGTLGGTGTLAGPVTTSPGTTLAPGASIGTLTINSDLTIGGNLAIEVNKSLVQSNDLVVVSGLLSKTGAGTLTVSNLGPALVAGDKFTLFSQPVTGGAVFTITGGGAGVTWTNNLALDGSISVLSATPPAPPTLSFTSSPGSLQFTWTNSGFKLQSQTNALSSGLKTNWSDYPGGGTSPVTVPTVATNPAVFFRLAPTP